MGIPLIADDFPNIAQSLTWGSFSGLPTLLTDAQFRLRSTSYWTMFTLWQIGDLTPWVYHAASLLLHILNAWLLFAVIDAIPRIRTAAPWAALFFAIHEGHQEAVMWFSAVNELLMFGFGMASLLCWLYRREALSIAFFVLALLSKESAVILLPLFCIVDPGRWKRLAPHAMLTLLAVASIVQSRTNSFRFNDGSFSLSAPFWLTWPRSFARLLWVWGWVAAVALWFRSERKVIVTAVPVLLWIGIALIPYSFLTYSTQIPSRQVYLASAGLALLVGIAASLIPGRRLATLVLVLLLVHNVGYLWTKKRSQFVERAQPTAQLIAAARQTRSPIWVQCFPLPPIVAEEAVRLAAGRSPGSLVWTPAASAVPFCYSPVR
jgi:hypothetical protein